MGVKNRSVKADSPDSNSTNAFRLSTRQTKIAQLAATGLTNREIASDLNLTEQIVKNALHSVFNRLGVWNRVELANFLLRDEDESCQLSLGKIEKDRLTVLEKCKILDLKAEVIFDELANIAATMFQIPIALVAFADPARFRFKSNNGLDANEVPREVLMCYHSIRIPKLLLASKAFKAPGFFCDPPLQQAGVRFHAAVPILKDGYALGVVCIVGRGTTGEFSSSQLAVIQSLARVATEMVDLRLKLS